MAKYGIKGIDSQKLKQYNGKKSTFRLEQREKERDFKEGGESMAATIADVANLAGCSITTVSRAFSVPEKVRPQTRERILQAAETLRYSPNAIARAMVHQRNHNLAFVVDPWQYPIMDAFYAEIAGAVQLEAEQLGYCVYTTASDRRELFMKKRVDGVILAGRADEGLLSDLRGQGIPAVQINDRPVSDDVPSITTDHYQGACQALEHLIAQGHTRVGLVTDCRLARLTDSRRAYEDVLRRHGLPFHPAYICPVEPHIETVRQAVDRMLAQSDAPTALFCMNDCLAVGAMKAAVRRGLRVPDELAIVGYDGSSLCRATEPELSSVRVDGSGMGRRGAHMLIDLIEGRLLSESRVVMQPELTLRGTT